MYKLVFPTPVHTMYKLVFPTPVIFVTKNVTKMV